MTSPDIKAALEDKRSFQEIRKFCGFDPEGEANPINYCCSAWIYSEPNGIKGREEMMKEFLFRVFTRPVSREFLKESGHD